MKKLIPPYLFKNLFPLFLFAFSSSALLDSCKKVDFSNDGILQSQKMVKQNFFHKYRTSDEKENKIVQYLERLESKYHFVEKTEKQIGYPRFNKMIVTKAASTTSLLSSNDSTEIFVIPFVRDTQNFVNASMIIHTSTTDTTVSYNCDWQYSEKQNSFQSITDTAEYFAIHFMYLDNLVFGYEDFIITDSVLFNKNHKAAKKISFHNPSSHNQSSTHSNLIDLVEVCQTSYVYVNNCTYQNTTACANGCDQCWWCTATISVEYCWMAFVESGGSDGGTGTGGTGGGGSGGGVYTPPTCGSTPATSSFVNSSNVATPCNGGGGTGGGWIPADDDDDPNSSGHISYISSMLELNQAQILFLTENPSFTNTLQALIIESTANENPLTNLPYNPSIDPICKIASKTLIDAEMMGIVSDGYDYNHFNLLKQNIPSNYSQPNFDPMWVYMFAIECLNIKSEHPEYSNAKVYWYATVEVTHLLLDGAGMVPLIGEIADLANGAIYSLQGDGVNAAFSFAAAIPIGGWVSTPAKYAKKLIIAANGSKRTLKWIKTSNGLINFGDRGLLRKVLGLKVGDPRIAHHLIPWEHFNKSFIQKAAGSDFHMNEIMNGIPISSLQHSGSHALYNQKVNIKLATLESQSVTLNWTNSQCANEVRNLTLSIRNWIISHPNESINNIIIP